MVVTQVDEKELDINARRPGLMASELVGLLQAEIERNGDGRLYVTGAYGSEASRLIVQRMTAREWRGTWGSGGAAPPERLPIIIATDIMTG